MKRLALTCATATGLLVLCAAISIGALILGFALWPDQCDPSRLKFDHASWNAHQNQSAMLDDLITNVLRVGDSREAIVDILGPPTNEGLNVLRYDTACGDKWELRVWLDEKGLLTSATYHPY